jgi:hypothetical protein
MFLRLELLLCNTALNFGLNTVEPSFVTFALLGYLMDIRKAGH